VSSPQTATIETKVPSRLDRLPWSRFHWLIVIGLGTVWILDGLEVTLVGSIASRLTESGSGIDISTGQIGTAAAIYVAGACTGALFFGQLTDRFGRKKLFLITLAIYLTATGATAFAFAPWYFYVARFFTGAGIGGEYAAINSAIDELIPARVRGRVDLMINGSYWLGSAAGSAAALIFLDTAIFAKDFGWRLAFGMGVVLGFAILIVRRHVPESPRWLFIHGREEEAERIVSEIEDDVEEETGQELPEPGDSITVRQRETIPFRTIGRTAFKVYPRRAVLGLALFVGQAFIYNGVTFNLGTLFTTFYDVTSSFVPVFIIIFAIGNFLGPLTLGRLFDTVGRKPMIAGTYLGSAACATLLSFLFVGGTLSEWWFEALVVVTFFLASAGASAAYLTVSEIFPMETRALAIAFFYAVGTAIGGITGPLLFGHLIGSGERGQVIIAFLIGAGVMALGGIAELFLGVKAEQAELEDIAKPLTAEEAEEGGEEEQEEQESDPEALEHRRRAAEERARAAEHRAAVHELRPRAQNGDRRAAGRIGAEEALAAIADLRSAAEDQRASAREELADGEDGAQERAGAARARARAYDERVAELTSEHDAEAHAHRQLAVAANERARAREQRAAATAALAAADEREGAEEEVERARAELYERRARVHDERAAAAASRAEDDADAAGDHDRQAEENEELALAAEERLAAAAQRAGAQRIGGEREAEEDARERRRRAAERDRRTRERVARARSGLRRFRPGPGSVAGSPGMGIPPRTAPGEELEREVDAIARALDEHGATGRRDLARLVGARYWGPGRFGAALREAVEEGRARRLSRSTFAPSSAP
jgi:MFS family permease